MIFWDIATTIIRLAITAILVWKLLRFGGIFNGWERTGMGLAGGSSLMTISVVWDGQRSPFDGWAGFVFSFGILLYFVGRTARHWDHERNNRLQIDFYNRWKNR